MKNFFKLLFSKKKQHGCKDVAAADAIAMHIMNAERGATAKIKKIRT